MPDFNPDAFLAQPDAVPAAQASNFDPDAFLAQPEQPSQSGFDPDAFLAEQDDKQYGTLGQEAATFAEGIGQGVAGPLSTLAETKLLGIKPEDIAGRARANPILHGAGETAGLVGSLATDFGFGAQAVKYAGKIAEAANLGKITSAALKGALEVASFTGSDDITKAILGQYGSDPSNIASAALLHTGAGALMGGITGGVFNLGEGLVGKAVDSDYVQNLLKTGDPLGKTGLSDKLVQAVSVPATVKAASTVPGGMYAYGLIYDKVKNIAEKVLEKPISWANRYLVDTFMRLGSEGQFDSLGTGFHYTEQVAKGAAKASKGIDNLFTAGISQIAGPTSESAKKQLKDFIEQGQINKQMQNTTQTENVGAQSFAEGGTVKPVAPAVKPPDKFAQVFPIQNTLLNTAKGRISTYLNSLRPLPNQTKLPFDDKPSDRQKERNYNDALELAVNPLKILDKVNKANLTVEDMQHFTHMFPEVHSYLSKKITERMVKAQLKDEKPSYGKRMAMSLFLGAPLDSTLTPVAIQAAQSVFAQNQMQQPQPAPTKNKKGSSSLSKVSQSYQTDDQSREFRQQIQKV